MVQASPYEERELFVQIAKGNEQAFTRLFHIYTPKLLPFIFKLTRNEQLAKELVQETFLRLWVNRERLTEVSQPSAWIYKIASNVSLTWIKTNGNRARLLKKINPIRSENPVVETVESKELNLIISRGVNLLPQRRQEIYRLSREQGLSHQEIADRLQLSPQTVKNQIGISLKFLQEFINKETGLSVITLLLLLGR